MMIATVLTLIEAAQIISPIADEKCEEAKNNRPLVMAGHRTEIAIALAVALNMAIRKAEA